MKKYSVHFAGAVDGNKQNYLAIVNYVNKIGLKVISDHHIKRTIADIDKEISSESTEIFNKLLQWIRIADVVIFETSKRDLGIGYEIAYSLSIPKPTILLTTEDVKSFPHTILGMKSEYLQLVTYNKYNMQRVIKSAIDYALETMDVRFHVMIPNNLNQHLISLAEKRRTSKASVLRQIIRSHIQEERGGDSNRRNQQLPRKNPALSIIVQR